MAQRAAEQAMSVASVLAKMIEPAALMARNAELERQIVAGQPCDPVSWEKGPHAALFDKIEQDALRLAANLKLLGRAAGFDPKAPLGRP